MGSNEEYLDKLLQSVTNGETLETVEEHKYSEDMTDEELLASLVEMYSDELAEFKTEEIIHQEEADTDSESVVIQTENAQIESGESDVFPEEVLTESSALETAFESVEEETIEATETEYTSTDSDYLSQSDIEALLSSLQDEIPQTTTEVVNEEKIIEDFSNQNDAVLEEILSEPQEIDSQDVDLLVRDLNAEESSAENEDLLKEMGIESMSEEQIDELLNEAASVPLQDNTESAGSGEMNLDDLFGGFNFDNEFDPEHKAGDDLADLLGGMLGGNDELAEINELLQQADNSANGFETGGDIGGNDLLNELLNADSNVQPTPENKEKVKKEKVKKEKQPKEKKQKAIKEKKPKKKKEGESLWKKIITIMFEEEEEEPEKIRIGDGDDLANFVAVDENDAILAEMMNEDKKKGKKSKKKDKGKDNKKGKENSEDGEEVIDPKEQAKLEKQKQKAEKKAQKKKAKEEKKEADIAFLKAQPSISTKRAMVAFAFALTLMAVILIIYAFVPDAVEKGNARKAYYDKNYYKAFELLQGKDLNDSDTILLNKVTCILKMQRKLDSYNNYTKMNKELEALNALVEAVGLYEKEYTKASGLSIDKEYNAIYEEIIIILNGKYGVSEERAKEILAFESDAMYTISLQNIVDGKVTDNPEDSNKAPLLDVLPEEEDFLEGQ